MAKTLAFLMTTCDADSKHFERRLDEFTRLGYPFAVNFDRCSKETKRLFQSHPCYLGGYEQNDPKKVFDDRHRQPALDVIVKHGGFDWAAYTDTDEILDKRAKEMIPDLLEWDVDQITCSRVELWGNGDQRRLDGPFAPPGEFCRRFYNLRTGSWEYRHPDVHAPYFEINEQTRRDRGGPEYRERHCDLTVIHYAMMNREDVFKHTNRWMSCPWQQKYRGFYDRLQEVVDPPTVPFDYETWEGYPK